jgi:hypothetical protein
MAFHFSSISNFFLNSLYFCLLSKGGVLFPLILWVASAFCWMATGATDLDRKELISYNFVRDLMIDIFQFSPLKFEFKYGRIL